MSKIFSKKVEYPAIFEQAEEGGYNVSFPAFPGCVTFGLTFEEAKEKAGEVLELWLEEMAARNKKIRIYNKRPIIDEINVNLPAKIKISYAANNC
jgi:predicted RNase H-like HicB family nuclease